MLTVFKRYASYTMNPMGLICFILIIICGTTDLGFVVFGGVGASLSSFIVGATVSKYFPQASVFIFMMGCIAGHLFFGMYEAKG